MNKDFNYYLITDPKYYGNNKIDFEKKLSEVLNKKKVTIACFRDKTSDNYEELAEIFVKVCKKFNIKKILLNENLNLAIQLKCGIHLTSKQFHKIKDAKKFKLFTIISCHTKDDITLAIKEGSNAITYSPIFQTPNKGEPKGIEELDEISKNYNINIIALGGIINETQVLKLKKLKLYGFASIRYFI